MITVECSIPEALADALEALLCENVRSHWSLHQARKGEPFQLRGFFDDEVEAIAQYEELCIACPELSADPQIGEIEDCEWQEAYKQYIQPWSHANLHWVPAWQRASYPVPEGNVAVYLDAGMAFGTGSHETTRLMARRLLEFSQQAGESFPERLIIDAGCGSGILAISAYCLGARHLYGFDRDPEAIKVSRENLLFNDLSPEVIDFQEAGIEAGLAGRSADLILANIQADVLKIHAESFVDAMRPGGTLALSGILASELKPLSIHFEELAAGAWGGYTRDTRVDGEWADLVFHRAAAR